MGVDAGFTMGNLADVEHNGLNPDTYRRKERCLEQQMEIQGV